MWTTSTIVTHDHARIWTFYCQTKITTYQQQLTPVLKVVQERSRVSLPQSEVECPLPKIFKFIFDAKMSSFDALLVVFYVI